MYKSNFQIKNGKPHQGIKTRCTACRDYMIKNQTTFDEPMTNFKTPLNNKTFHYLNNCRTIFAQKPDEMYHLPYTPTRPDKCVGNVQTNRITTTEHVKHNKICVKYVATTLPPKEKFRISTKCISLQHKLFSLGYFFQPQNLISKKNKASKFDGCRPLLVSLECKCGSQYSNSFNTRCICKKDIDCNPDDKLKKNSHRENLCSNGSKELKKSSGNKDQNKNSLCSLLPSR